MRLEDGGEAGDIPPIDCQIFIIPILRRTMDIDVSIYSCRIED
jgi:hypothetical protein